MGSYFYNTGTFFFFLKVCEHFNLKAMDSNLEELWPYKMFYK